MKTESENAIKVLAVKINSDTKADDALKYTQAALNLAHVLATLDNIEKKSKQLIAATDPDGGG